ncbi:MAG: ferrochelatase, partial [Acetobacter sp.]|nr:ferrochelatase [Acetobacter sp.]
MIFDSIVPSLHNQTTSLSPTPRIGIILAALGTPDKPTYHAVRRYLSEFLSDRRVIETHPLIWQPFLQGIILLTRPVTSSRAYRRIWNNTKNE